MAMIALVSGKSSPGVTMSVALLASVWPSSVVAVDADPVGGDLAIGWLGGNLAHPDRSVLSFAIETARSSGAPARLDQHLQSVRGVPNCRLLAGLTDWTQLRFVTPADWHRLATALSEHSRSGSDVIVDCGRFGPATPMPMLTAADLVLIAVRPSLLDRNSARCLAGQLRSVIHPDKLGLAVCATTTLGTIEVEQHLGLYAMLALPDNRRVARTFSGGRRRPIRFRRSRLVRTATHSASLLHVVLNQQRSTVPAPQATAMAFDGNRYDAKSSG
jgi:cellulose biosynthesis protein BcsQ